MEAAGSRRRAKAGKSEASESAMQGVASASGENAQVREELAKLFSLGKQREEREAREGARLLPQLNPLSR